MLSLSIQNKIEIANPGLAKLFELNKVEEIIRRIINEVAEINQLNRKESTE